MENTQRTIMVGFWCTLSLIYVMTASVSFARAETVLPHNFQITENTTWTASESPYVVSGRVYVHSGAMLTIEAGTRVLFTRHENSGIDARGKITAIGTVDEPIVFTSIAESQQTDSEYNGLGVLSGGVGVFEHIQVEHAQFSINAYNATVSLVNSHISKGHHGVTVTESTLRLDSVSIDNTRRPVLIDTLTAAKLTTHNTTITNSKDDPDGILISPGTSDPDQIELKKDVPFVFTGGMYFRSNFRRLLVQEGAEIIITKPLSGAVNRSLHFSDGQTFTIQGTQENPVIFNGAVHGSTSSVFLFKYARFVNNSDTTIMVGNQSRLDAQQVTISGGSTIGIAAYDKATVQLTESNIVDSRFGVQVSDGAKVSMLAGGITDSEHAVYATGKGEIDLHTVRIRDNIKGIVSKDILGVGNNTIRVFQSAIVNNEHGFSIEHADSFIFQNIIAGNAIGADAPDEGPIVPMENNWWGDASGPFNATTNPSGLGNFAALNIDFDPWLGEAPFEYSEDASGGGNEGGSGGGNGTGDNGTGDDEEDDDEPARTPVLLIPGNMGSELIKNYGDSAEVWLNLTRLILSPTDAFLNELALLPNGIEDHSRPMKIGDMIRSVAPPIGNEVSIYNNLIKTFVDAGYVEGESLFVFPYDWRMSVSTIAPFLATKIYEIQSATNSQKVHLVGHSMGGLVAKQYMADFGSESVASVAFIGTPHLGSMKATKMLLYGDNMGLGIGKITVLNANRAKTISQNMPGVYDLLPSKKYTELAQEVLFSQYDSEKAKATILGYDHEKTKEYMVSVGSNEQLIPRSEIVHEEIDAFSAGSVPVYNFVGCIEGGQDSATISAIQIKNRMALGFDGKKRIKSDYQLLYTSGDGIVSSLSASSVPASQTYMVKDTSHTSLPSSSGLGSVLLAHYKQETPVLSGSVSAMTTECTVSGKTISIHGPVRVSVVDAGGNKTEADTDGNITESITGVSYTQIEDVTFVYVPNTFAGEIQITPKESPASFDVYVRLLSVTAEIESQTLFSQIPVHIGSVYSIAISPTAEVSAVLEEKQDATILSHAITAHVSGQEASDITPPVTSVSVENGTVTLTSTDSLAGVLRTEYSENQEDWNEYTESFTASGKRIWYMATDRAGNMEEMQYVDVPETETVSEEHDDGEEGGGDGDSGATSGGGGGGASGGGYGGDYTGGYSGTIDLDTNPTPIPDPASEPQPEVIPDIDIENETVESQESVAEIAPIIARFVVPRKLVAPDTTLEQNVNMPEKISPAISANVGDIWISQAVKVALSILSFLLIVIIIMLVKSIHKQEDQYLQT